MVNPSGRSLIDVTLSVWLPVFVIVSGKSDRHSDGRCAEAQGAARSDLDRSARERELRAFDRPGGLDGEVRPRDVGGHAACAA